MKDSSAQVGSRPRPGTSHSAWVPVITLLGVAAAAVLLARRLREQSGPLSLDIMLDRCDRAADALDERLCADRVAMAG